MSWRASITVRENDQSFQRRSFVHPTFSQLVSADEQVAIGEYVSLDGWEIRVRDICHELSKPGSFEPSKPSLYCLEEVVVAPDEYEELLELLKQWGFEG